MTQIVSMCQDLKVFSYLRKGESDFDAIYWNCLKWKNSSLGYDDTHLFAVILREDLNGLQKPLRSSDPLHD